MLRPGFAIIALWVAFALSWLAAAGWSTTPERRRKVPMLVPFGPR